MNFTKTIICLLVSAVTAPVAAAFNIGSPNNPDRQVAVHGSVNVDGLVPEREGSLSYKEKLLGNVYADVGLFNKYIDAGLRLEYLDHPLPAFYGDAGFKGWGIGNFYAVGKYKGFRLLAGDIYEQFGSGLILRTYEDRALGIDNAIRGGSLKIDALNGFHFTVLGGVQRRYWSWDTRSRVYGADVEWDIRKHIPALARHGIIWTVGASWVQKREDYSEPDDSIYTPLPYPYGPTGKDEFLTLKLPRRVNAFDVRTRFNKGYVDILAEFALKHPDPTADNNYTFGRGTAMLIGATYARRGVKAEIRAGRYEDMSFRSRRTMTDLTTFINHLPSFTQQSSYALASVYPVSTQSAPGEWAFQGNFALDIMNSTKLSLNLSYICGLEREGAPTKVDDTVYGKDAVKTSFFGMGPLYYQDINVRLDQKLSPKFTLTAMYLFQRYNKTAIEGRGGTINAHIGVLEGRMRCSEKVALRAELQYLATKQDKGDRLYWLVEANLLRHLTVSASDEYNIGNPHGNREHYYMFNVTGRYRSNRLTLGYGRTREGLIGSEGICRYVPATRGFRIAYSYTF